MTLKIRVSNFSITNQKLDANQKPPKQQDCVSDISFIRVFKKYSPDVKVRMFSDEVDGISENYIEGEYNEECNEAMLDKIVKDLFSIIPERAYNIMVQDQNGNTRKFSRIIRKPIKIR